MVYFLCDLTFKPVFETIWMIMHRRMFCGVKRSSCGVTDMLQQTPWERGCHMTRYLPTSRAARRDKRMSIVLPHSLNCRDRETIISESKRVPTYEYLPWGSRTPPDTERTQHIWESVHCTACTAVRPVPISEQTSGLQSKGVHDPRLVVGQPHHSLPLYTRCNYSNWS